MNEQQNIPTPVIVDAQQVANIQHSNKINLRWALVCLIGPTALIIISVIAYAVVNFVTASATPQAANDELFANQPFGINIFNIILYLAGATAALTWLPGIIAGIVLLALRRRT